VSPATSHIYNSYQKSERDVPIFDTLRYFSTTAARFLFLISLPGMLVLRASCFILRLCLATPLEGRLAFVLTGVVSICVAPCVLIL
jgi:hypothetical protein